MSDAGDEDRTPGGTLVATPPRGQLAKVLDYLGYVAKNRPLVELLDEAPRRIADCIGADVASLYLLEGDGRTLVMRGNVGLPRSAPGRVRLEVGQGITGKAVELRYPIAVDRAASHAAYQGFPELGEERFPAFLAVPVLGTSRPLGAVVVQRRGRGFTDQEVCLVTALTAPISSALRLARLLDDMRGARNRRTGGGTRKVTLPGLPLFRGRALGAVAAIRRPAVNTKETGSDEGSELLQQALDQAERRLRALADRAATLSGDEAAFIDSYLLMLQDQQLRRTAFLHIEAGASIGRALGQVARQAARAASESGDAFLVQRARDLEALCDTLLMMARPDSRATIPAKAILVGEELTIYDLFVTARAQPVGVVLSEAPRPRTKLLVQLLGVPTIADVRGAFRWMSPGDVALLDADHGLLTINPTRADIAAYRAEKRRERRSQPGRRTASS
ncbi:MAG TPA: GAF domain-containing protein [Polyangiaceae bacterium]|nr:GAF domain-containing protein [Polyangiaceae bacterium]